MTSAVFSGTYRALPPAHRKPVYNGAPVPFLSTEDLDGRAGDSFDTRVQV